MEEIDLRKAILGKKDWFPPLYNLRPVRLADLLARKERFVDPDAQLLVVERPNGSVALLGPQMAYHHIAQGEFEGEPWMASF